ncbi:MAG: TMEM165/GDT1 family protein [Promethearchaeota archaeon]
MIEANVPWLFKLVGRGRLLWERTIHCLVSFFSALALAFGVVFLAELGDKTQLVVFALASRSKSKVALAAGAAAGFAAVVALGGVVATFLSRIVAGGWVALVTGVTFLVLGSVQLAATVARSSEPSALDGGGGQEMGDKGGVEGGSRRVGFLAGFLSVAGMEMGDKTQVATVVLAATAADAFEFAGTLTGSWLALSSLAVAGAAVGGWLAERVPKRVVDLSASVLFLVVGLLVTTGAARSLA